MPTAKNGYYLADGTRLPSVTTILSRFKESGALMKWAFEMGRSGAESLYSDSGKAADIGTAAHSMIEIHINGGNPHASAMLLSFDDEMRGKATNAFDMYLRWERQTGLRMLSKFQEVQLLSPSLRFAGTPDAIAEIDGEIVLIDWKTSGAAYSDYLVQLAAYQHLVNEGVRMDTGEPLGVTVSKGAYLCRFSKDFPDFEARYFGDLTEEWAQFVRFREAYTADWRIKKRAA